MIRLPASSISLSDNDVSFHLQQIDIYQGLLKQGFKPNDILRYFAEHRAATQTDNGKDEPNSLDEPIPSCVELVSRSQPFHDEQSISAVSSRVEDDTENALASHDAMFSSSFKEDTAVHQTPKSARESVSPNQPSNLPALRHAPRQSSLLRFSEAASSKSSSTASTEREPSSLFGPSIHRPHLRTDAYSYSQSEIDEVELSRRLTHLQVAHTESVSNTELGLESPSPLRAEAQIFIPMNRLRLHPGPPVIGDTSASVRVNTWRDFPRELPISTSSTRDNYYAETQPFVQSEIQSSPPTDATSPQTDTSQHSSPLLASSQFPVTPTPVRRRIQNTNTNPRHHQYLDGETFSVYNDALPRTAQPQTPADLHRRYLVTAREAAYTAPPGMIRFHTSRDTRRNQAVWRQAEHGEPSPTVRAIGMRERRARELTRSVRAETLRLERTRERARGRTARGGGGSEELTDELGPLMDEDQWREELEGDRVGEENFEDDGDLAGIRARGEGIRVVSGNARTRL